MSQNIGTDGQSFKGYCGLAEEDDYGDGGDPEVYLPIRSDGFGLENTPLFDSNIRGRGRYQAAAGVFEDDGSVELVAGPENGLGYLLKGAFGDADVETSSEGDGSDNVGEHTFSTSDKLPSWAVELGLGSIDAARHVGTGVDTIEFSHTPEEYLIISADLTAKKPEMQGSQASPTYSDIRPFVWHDGVVTVEGDDRTADLAEFTMSLENGIDEKIRGGRTPDKAHVGERTISGNLNLDFENMDMLERFLGEEGASTPQDELFKAELNAKWETPELIVDDGDSQYSLELDVPKVTLSTHEAQLNEQDAIVENIEWEAEVDAGDTGYDAQAILTNGITDSY